MIMSSRLIAAACLLTAFAVPAFAHDTATMTCAEFAALDPDAMMTVAEAIHNGTMAGDDVANEVMADDAMAGDAMADDNMGSDVMAACDGMAGMTVMDAMAGQK